MKWIFYLLIVVTFVACNSKTTNKNTQVNIVAVTESTPEQEMLSTQDSIQIQDLVRAVYAWNEQHLKNYFNIGIPDNQDVNYLGIDWGIFEENKRALLATGYFANDFIENYKATLEHIEQKLNAGNYKEGWKVGYMPPFGTGANQWCHCQDTPSPDFYK